MITEGVPFLFFFFFSEPASTFSPCVCTQAAWHWVTEQHQWDPGNRSVHKGVKHLALMDHSAITGQSIFCNKAKHIPLWDCISFMNKEIRCESIYLYEYITLFILWPRSKSEFLKQLPWALTGIGFITTEIGGKKKKSKKLNYQNYNEETSLTNFTEW